MKPWTPWLLGGALVVAAATAVHSAPGAALSSSFLERADRGEAQELLVLFDTRSADAEADAVRLRKGALYDDDEVVELRARRYDEVRQKAFAELADPDLEETGRYAHFPISLITVGSRRGLARLVARSEVLGVYEDRPLYANLAQSLPLIRQPAVAALGDSGAGATVAILDTGVDYRPPDFGSCTTSGPSSGCRVVAAGHVAFASKHWRVVPDWDVPTDTHGTNVAGIVAGVAPGASIASVNVFTNGGTTTAQVLAGIDWAIQNQSVLKIVALNMSLGDTVDHTAPCASDPFNTAAVSARAAGILPVAAAGNSAFTDGLSSPACAPGVVSVGAVYDSDVGGWGWGTGSGTCTDYTTTADQIACFSNSASFLTMLAPGAFITAAGITMGGTSQASPHVAGAAAVLRAAFPAETLDQTTARMTQHGVPITDPRNRITKPRLDLLAAVAPVSDGDVPFLPPAGVGILATALAAAARIARRPRAPPAA